MPVDLQPEKETSNCARLKLLQVLKLVGVLDSGRFSELQSQLAQDNGSLKSASQTETLRWLLNQAVLSRSDLETVHLFASELSQAIEAAESEHHATQTSQTLANPQLDASTADSARLSFLDSSSPSAEDTSPPQRLPFSMAAKPGELDALQAGLSSAEERRRSHRRKHQRRREREEEVPDEHEWRKPWQLTFKENAYVFLHNASEKTQDFLSVANRKIRANPRNSAIAAGSVCILFVGSMWLFSDRKPPALPEQSLSRASDFGANSAQADTSQASPPESDTPEPKTERAGLIANSLAEKSGVADKADKPQVQKPMVEAPSSSTPAPAQSPSYASLNHFAKLAQAGAYDEALQELNRLRSDASISLPTSDIYLLGYATLLAQGGEEAYRKTGKHLLGNVELESRLWTTVFGAWLIHSDANEREAAIRILDNASPAPIASKMKNWVIARERNKEAAAYLESLPADTLEPADFLFRAMAYMEAGERARALQDLGNLDDLRAVSRRESNPSATAQALALQLCDASMRRAAETIYSHLTGNTL